MEHRVVATLQNERGGAQKLNHRLQGLMTSFKCMASETKCIDAVLLRQIRHQACVLVISWIVWRKLMNDLTSRAIHETPQWT